MPSRQASELVPPTQTVIVPSTPPGYLAPEFSRLQNNPSNRTSIATPGIMALVIWCGYNLALERRHDWHHNILQICSPHSFSASPCGSTAPVASQPRSARLVLWIRFDSKSPLRFPLADGAAVSRARGVHTAQLFTRSFNTRD